MVATYSSEREKAYSEREKKRPGSINISDMNMDLLNISVILSTPSGHRRVREVLDAIAMARAVISSHAFNLCKALEELDQMGAHNFSTAYPSCFKFYGCFTYYYVLFLCVSFFKKNLA